MHIDHALTDRYFLKRCKITDIERVSKFYQYVSENTENMARFGKWIYGLHPAKEQIEAYISSPALCIHLKQAAKYSELSL